MNKMGVIKLIGSKRLKSVSLFVETIFRSISEILPAYRVVHRTRSPFLMDTLKALLRPAFILLTVSKCLGAPVFPDKKANCSPFKWKNDGGNEKASMEIQAIINNRSAQMQLDTGIYNNIIYKNWKGLADQNEDGRLPRFSARVLLGQIEPKKASFSVDRAIADDQFDGSLGLVNLIEKVSVIDYPDKLFCLFDVDSFPASQLPGTQWIKGELRDNHLLLPLKLGNLGSRFYGCDTGSSLFPLIVDLDNWKVLTNLERPHDAAIHTQVGAFGKSLTLDGEGLSSSISETAPFEIGYAFTIRGQPRRFKERLSGVSGIIGNQPFLSKVVILDLTKPDARFGIAPPPIRPREGSKVSRDGFADLGTALSPFISQNGGRRASCKCNGNVKLLKG